MNGDRSEPTFYANNFCQRLESMSPIGTHIPSTLISESQKLSHQLTAENGMKLTLSRPSSQRNECDIIAGDRSKLRMSFLLSSIRFEFRRKNGWAAARNSRLYFIGSRVFNWYSLWAMGYGPMVDHAYVSFYLYISFPVRRRKKFIDSVRYSATVCAVCMEQKLKLILDLLLVDICVCISVATGQRKCFFMFCLMRV